MDKQLLKEAAGQTLRWLWDGIKDVLSLGLLVAAVISGVWLIMSYPLILIGLGCLAFVGYNFLENYEKAKRRQERQERLRDE